MVYPCQTLQTTALQIDAVDFPVFAHIACDVLVIPGVGISVEWFFLVANTHYQTHIPL